LSTDAGAELEGITGVLLLTDEDDFNALASIALQASVDGFVHRIAPPSHSHGVVAPYTGGEMLFGAELSRPELVRRYEGGARIVGRRVEGELPAGDTLLFVVRPDGSLATVTESDRPDPGPGDTVILLSESRPE
jgi:hypothetical protein